MAKTSSQNVQKSKLKVKKLFSAKLGDLDSNQDDILQRDESYQLDDLPALPTTIKRYRKKYSFTTNYVSERRTCVSAFFEEQVHTTVLASRSTQLRVVETTLRFSQRIVQ